MPKGKPKSITEFVATNWNAPHIVSEFTRKKAKPKTRTYAELQEIEKNIMAQLKKSGEYVWVHNVSGSYINIPPLTNKGDDYLTAIGIELNDLKEYPVALVKEQRFRQLLMDEKLVLVSAEDVDDIRSKQEDALRRDPTVKMMEGVSATQHASGLPMNRKEARLMIDDEEDIDQLNMWMQDDDRPRIREAIQDRIEELEDLF